MKILLSSQKGFGLIESMVALIIAMIAMVGLFIGSHFAKIKAIENMHYRTALLQATDILENIKYQNRKTKKEPHLTPYTSSFTIDERDGNPLVANIQVDKASQSDIQIGVNVKFTRVTVTISWEEPYKYLHTSGGNVSKSIALVEDYYFTSR